MLQGRAAPMLTAVRGARQGERGSKEVGATVMPPPGAPPGGAARQGVGARGPPTENTAVRGVRGSGCANPA